MKTSVRKAIIPVAGLGTRFLPVTKTIPKEMLPIVDRPAVQYVVEEAIQAGIKDIIFVQGRGKTALEDYFDLTFELESKLEKEGRSELIQSLIEIRDAATFISIRQKEARGLGHAVLCARSVVGNEPFIVMLGDEITISKERIQNPTAQLMDHFHTTGKSVVSVIEVPAEEVHRYGVISYKGAMDSTGVRVESLVEKPKRGEAPSFFALPGRYLFTPSIFNFLAEARPSLGGEIQLTDSIDQLAKFEGLYALPMKARRFDIGNKLDFLRANIELALDRSDMRKDVLAMMQNLIHRKIDQKLQLRTKSVEEAEL